MNTKKIIDDTLRPVLRPMQRWHVKSQVKRYLDNEDPEIRTWARRIDYAMRVAVSPSRRATPSGNVPEGQALPQADRDWGTGVGIAVRENRPRLPHPHPDIEKLLQDVAAASAVAAQKGPRE